MASNADILIIGAGLASASAATAAEQAVGHIQDKPPSADGDLCIHQTISPRHQHSHHTAC